MSRVLLNDEKLSGKITREFIPVSGAIEDLQPSRYGGRETEASRWFQAMAKKAFKLYAPKGWWEQFKTYQGLYVVGADGTPYDYQVVWKLSASKYMKALGPAMERVRKNPSKKVAITRRTIENARPESPDPSTSVLRVFSRVRPVPKGADPSNQGIGRDHMWIWRDEVQELLRTGEMPDRIVGRFIRFHLLDTVRNVSAQFGEGDVRKAEFTMKLLLENRRTRTFTFTGTYASRGTTEADDKGFGVEGTLSGEFEIDVQKAKILRFRAYGEATCWGQLGTMAPKGKYPLVFAVVDANDEISSTVPPFYYNVSPIFKPLYRDPKFTADE